MLFRVPSFMTGLVVARHAFLFICWRTGGDLRVASIKYQSEYKKQ
jgi:hypothetical protein